MQNRIAYIFDFVFLFFIVILRFLFIDKLNTGYNLFIIIFFILAFVILYKLLGFRKSNGLIAESATQIAIIALLLFILITYLSGLYFGFLRNSYSLNIRDILSNTYSVAIIIVLEELVRWMIAKSLKKDIKPLIILTILYVVLDVALEYNPSIKGIKLFIFITESVMANIARHSLASYITMKISYIPSLIICLFFGLYVYVLPIFPDYGYYISSVIGLVFPYLVYLAMNKLVKYQEREKKPVIRKKLWYFNIPLAICLVFVVVLVSGVFKYQIMAIGSGSMEPIVYRGDAIVFEKYDDELINVNDIIVFRQKGKFITHRVIDIIESSGKIRYITKGDANENQDDYITFDDDIVGIVKFRIKYIGLPTIWFQELIS